MKSPVISIITVTYNAAATLPRTMVSVVRQSYRDYEHIIIDGGSTDGTLDIAATATIVVSEPDHGLYDAMNKGLRMAHGEYLLFLNAGDTFADEGVLAQYAAAASPEVDIIYADTDLVDNDGVVVGRRHLSAPHRLTVASFAKGMLVCHQAFMVRRSIAPYYDLKYRFSADYDWCIRCMLRAKGSFVNINRVAVHYLNEGVTTANHRASLKERYEIMVKYYGRIPTMLRHIGFFCRRMGFLLKNKFKH